MSYRLITKAILSIVNATGVKSEREIEVRAYPAPKRDASGAIEVDGVSASYKRTGGKGRGTADNRYMYFPAKGESAYCDITESEAQALVGGTVVVTSVAAPAPVATPAAPAPVVADGPTDAAAESRPAELEQPDAPAPALTRAQRRAARAEA